MTASAYKSFQSRQRTSEIGDGKWLILSACVGVLCWSITLPLYSKSHRQLPYNAVRSSVKKWLLSPQDEKLGAVQTILDVQGKVTALCGEIERCGG